MATLKTISAALELVDSKKQNLKKAFDDLLHSHSQLFSSSSSLPLSWEHLDSHFTSLHHSLSQRFLHLQSLESKQQTKNPNPNPYNLNPNEPSPSFSDQNPKVSHFPSLHNVPSSSSDRIRANENVTSGAKNHAEALCALCKSMNGKALRDYIGENLRDKAVIKVELRTALKLAPDPAAMVLDSVDGVFGGVAAVRDAVEMKKVKKSVKKSFNVLFQQLRTVGPNLSFKVRKRAMTIADDWKGSLVSGNGARRDAMGVMAFLHFVAAYSLLSELTLNELATFSAMVAANDELPELYRIIGWTEKVPALVQKLIDKGKHVLAVKYVFEFNLTDKIPPVPILEAYLNESQKLAQRLSEEGKTMGEITGREIHALKSVIRVIESHNLDSEYPRASLEQRIEQLEKQKTNVKRSAPAFARKIPQHQQQQSRNKRPRMSAPAGPAAVLNNVNSAGSTIHQYQQPHIHSTGLLPEHPNPYMSMQAMPYGMAAPAPSISPYQGASAGPYGLVGVPMGPSVNPGQSGSHPNSSEPHVPSGYYDGTVSAYGGYDLQRYYQQSYPQ